MKLTKTLLERLYKTHTAKDIALKFKVSPRVISRYLRQFQIPKAPRTLKGEIADVDFIKTLGLAGYKNTEIAEDLGVSYDLVLRTNRKAYPKLDKDKLEQLFCVERKGYAEISEILGVCQTTVWRSLKRYNLIRTFNPPKEEFIQAYLKYTRPQLAKMYKVSIETIKETIEKYEIKKLYRPREKKYSKEYIEGLFMKHTTLEMAKILNVCEYSVLRMLRGHGLIESRKPKAKEYKQLLSFEKKPVYEMFLKLNEKFKKEWCIKEVAKHYEVTIVEVRRCIKEMTGKILTETPTPIPETPAIEIEEQDMTIKLQPLNDKIVVKLSEETNRTESGLYLSSSTDREKTGIVVAIGPGRPLLNSAEYHPLPFEVGSKLLLKWGVSDFYPFTIDGVKYYEIDPSHVIGVL